LSELYEKAATGREESFAVILAGGDGLDPRAKMPAHIRGARPSHYIRKHGSDFALNTTRAKVALAFRPENTLFVVTESHASYYREVLADVPQENLIVQPQDDGTTAAMLYAAMRVAARNPFARIAFFPPELRVLHPRNFMKQVEAADEFVQDNSRLVLFGFKPNTILPGGELIEFESADPLDGDRGVWSVRRVLGHPTREEAAGLVRQGALINSPVIVGRAAAFIRSIREAKTDLYKKFAAARSKMGDRSERAAVRRAYHANFEYSDFSKDVLPAIADELAVIPVLSPLKMGVEVKLPEYSPVYYAPVRTMQAAAGYVY
jgi:mannose-1-phosphate guanylyltransferase